MEIFHKEIKEKYEYCWYTFQVTKYEDELFLSN